MFRRSKSAQTLSTVPGKPGGKGRPTPTRKEAEAAARERAKVPRTRRERNKRTRSSKVESSKEIRAAMKEGDERYLLARDKGSVRRFIRDYIDSRFSFVEMIIPFMLLSLVLGYSGNARLMEISTTIMFGALLLVIFDLSMLRRRLRKEIATRFPDEGLKGTTYYAITRSMQMKFMRIPKPKVKIGQPLPDHYR